MTQHHPQRARDYVSPTIRCTVTAISGDGPGARVITLTGGVRVRILDEEWPTIAHDRWQVGRLEFSAPTGWIYVRRHVTDRRVIVYGGYDTKRANERNVRAGEIVLPPAANSQVTHLAAIASAIVRIAQALRASERFAAELIARLPPVEL